MTDVDVAPASRGIYFSGARWEAILTTCVWSSVSHASTPLASASARPSLTAVSCVADTLCGAFGITLIVCSRTAVECETRTSPDFASDNDSGFLADTIGVWIALGDRRCPVRHMRSVNVS